MLANLSFGKLQHLRQVAVGETVLLGVHQEVVGRQPTLVLQNLLLAIHKFLHLLDEPRLDIGPLMERFDGGSLAQRFVQNELALAGRIGQQR
jgi:hypothetical protein